MTLSSQYITGLQKIPEPGAPLRVQRSVQSSVQNPVHRPVRGPVQSPESTWYETNLFVVGAWYSLRSAWLVPSTYKLICFHIGVNVQGTVRKLVIIHMFMCGPIAVCLLTHTVPPTLARFFAIISVF